MSQPLPTDGQERLLVSVDWLPAHLQDPDVVVLDATVLLYCGGGISAAATAFALTLQGRANVMIYDGSLQQWSANPALPITTGATPT